MKSVFSIPVFMAAACMAGAVQAAPERPKIIKTGTIDIDVVEAHNFVWNGRLLRENWCKPKYQGERGLPGSHISIKDAETGKLVASLAPDHAFGTVYVEDGTVYVVATCNKAPKRRTQVNIFASRDLKTWEQWTAIDDPQFNICNTSLIKVKDEYVMMFEISKPHVTSWTARFAKSKDLKKWEILPEEYIHGKRFMAAPHFLAWHDGYFYNFHVRNKYGYSVFVSRSRDLKTWEDSPLNPVMRADEDDRKIAPGVVFTEAQKQRIATAKDINNSDIDVLEHDGKCVISYSWGNQHGTEHLATAKYRGTLASFLEGWFPPAGPQLPERKRSYHLGRGEEVDQVSLLLSCQTLQHETRRGGRNGIMKRYLSFPLLTLGLAIPVYGFQPDVERLLWTDPRRMKK